MKILLLNASPKHRFSASQYFLDLLKIQLMRCELNELKFTGRKSCNEIFDCFKTIDALVIALPVYVDGVPAKVLEFLTEAEEFCKRENCKFKLYVISNCGFFEGRQCKNALSIMRSFCTAAGLEWGTGLGIGGGEMLNILRLIIPAFEFVKLLLTMAVFVFTNRFLEGLLNYNWISVIISMSIFFAFNFGLFASLFKLQRIIKKGGKTLNFYSGVTCCPRLLFTVFACCYWIIRASFHGTNFFQLYRKIKN